MMRRYLVLTDESRRHSFLANLPAHVLHVGDKSEPRWRPLAIDAEDVRQFLMAYCACLLAVATYIF